MKPEKPLTDKELEEWENSRDLDAELLDSVRQMKAKKGRAVKSPVKSSQMKSGISRAVSAKLQSVAIHTPKDQIEKELTACETSQSAEQAYEPFILEEYVDNPVALARIKAGITQEQLAQRLGVSQAYVSQLERRTHVINKMLERVHIAIRGEG